MTPEERERQHAIAAEWPVLMEFFEGPYCGTLLEPHTEDGWDVHRRDCNDDLRQIPFSKPPWKFVPISAEAIALSGDRGDCRYVLRNKRWTFDGYVTIVPAEESE